ncbi:hypothetical protein CMI47_01940 [Candidatus Pacearchaeota archaeon]|jgi:hypothetical protein|nr:hypothetical protein [Candidatus Pacearchaeota archaeon]
MLKLELEKHPKLGYPLFVIAADPENPDSLWEIKDDLKALKFRYYSPRKVYNKNAKYVTDDDINKLKSLGVDVSIYSQFKNNEVDVDSLHQEDATISKHTPALTDQFSFLIQKIQQSNVSEDQKGVQLSMVEGLRAMASGTDEAAKQAFIIDFLRFSRNFWNYSWYNTMLIWLQMREHKLSATHVRGAKQWETMGRKVIEESQNNGANILIPIFKKDRIEKDDLQKAQDVLKGFMGAQPSAGALSNPSNVSALLKFVRTNVSMNLSAYIRNILSNKKFVSVSSMIGYIGAKANNPGYDFKDSGYVNGFKDGVVFDIEQTEELTGEELEEFKKKTGNSPFRAIPRDSWLGSEDEDPDTEEGKAQLQEYTDALIDFAKSKNIDVKFEDTGEAGGYSAIGKVVIDQEAKGVSLLKTLIHELAHEMVHTKDIRRGARGKKGWFNLEVDAESIAFAVMTSLGFNVNSTYNYLALVTAKSSGITSGDIEQDKKKIQTNVITRLTENFMPIFNAATTMIKHLDTFSPKPIKADDSFNMSKISAMTRRRKTFLRTPREAATVLENMLEFFRSLSSKS